MDKKVSIIIPAYNVEEYINKCIQSCVGQTYKNIEIIVVDDGSTDNTWNEIVALSENDERIIHIRQENCGVAVARNTALDMASGDYLLFLDSDDWLEDNAVEMLLSYTGQENYLICSDCYFAYGINDNIRKVIQNKDYEYEKCIVSELMKYIGVSSKFRLVSSCYKLFKRDVVEKYNLRFEPGIHQGEDGLFTFKYICHTDGAIYFPEPLWVIYDRPGSACNSPYNDKWKSSLKAIDLMLDYGKELPSEVKELLFAFKAERARWLLINCAISNNYSKEDFLLFRKLLKDNASYLITRENSFKTRMQIFLYAKLPSGLSRLIIRLKK